MTRITKQQCEQICTYLIANGVANDSVLRSVGFQVVHYALTYIGITEQMTFDQAGKLFQRIQKMMPKSQVALRMCDMPRRVRS